MQDNLKNQRMGWICLPCSNFFVFWPELLLKRICCLIDIFTWDQVMSGKPYFREEVDVDRAMKCAVSGVSGGTLMIQSRRTHLWTLLSSITCRSNLTRDIRSIARQKAGLRSHGKINKCNMTRLFVSMWCWRYASAFETVPMLPDVEILVTNTGTSWDEGFGEGGWNLHDILPSCVKPICFSHVDVPTQFSSAQTKVLHIIDASVMSRVGRIVARFVRLC
jgi:hypothetical protein